MFSTHSKKVSFMRFFLLSPPPLLFIHPRDDSRAAQNVMTMTDLIENDSALSQMLRSVTPPGVLGTGPPPVVRIVRGAGTDARWTEVSPRVSGWGKGALSPCTPR